MDSCIDLLPVHVKAVLGFLPDWSCVIMVNASNKTFPIRCKMTEGSMCYSLLTKNERTPYEFMADVLTQSKARLVKAELTQANNALYSALYFRVEGMAKLCRISSDEPSNAINAALASRAPLLIDRITLNKLVDSAAGFEILKSYLSKNFGTIFPLPRISDTGTLKLLADFIDEAMPNGTVFNVKA